MWHPYGSPLAMPRASSEVAPREARTLPHQGISKMRQIGEENELRKRTQAFEAMGHTVDMSPFPTNAGHCATIASEVVAYPTEKVPVSFRRSPT